MRGQRVKWYVFTYKLIFLLTIRIQEICLSTHTVGLLFFYLPQLMMLFLFTHINEVSIVSDEQIAQDSSFVQVPQADHVLHPLYWGGMHRLDAALRGQP